MKIKKALLLGLSVLLFTGCGIVNDLPGSNSESNPTEENEPGGSSKTSKNIEDNHTLYEKDDETSVITMYLTVSTGNKSDNTNHTWDEVNSHSVYYYEEAGIERYAVNGLLQVGDENGPVEGEFGYGQYVPNATVTIRGQSSSLQVQKNYKISIRDEKGSWRNQKVINLNKHVAEGLRYRNKLVYDLMKELPGLMSMRTQFVHLYVKDLTEGGSGEFEDYGLYTQVEQPNKSYLQSHGLDKNGQLYKLNFFEFLRYEDVIMLKSDANYDVAEFEQYLEIKGNDDHQKLISMLEDVNDYSISSQELLDKWFNLDNITSWLAFQILIGNADTQSRNTLLYSPKNEDTWYFISWDNDDALRTKELVLQGNLQENGWENGISNYWGNRLFQRLLSDESFRHALDEKMNTYLSLLTEEKVQSMATSYSEICKPFVYSEADITYAKLTPEEYDEVTDSLYETILQNYELYKVTLLKPMPFFIGNPQMTTNGEILFHWDNSYSFNEENITYQIELSKDYSFEELLAKEEGLTIPEYQYKGTLEPGQYFVRIIAKNSSGYTSAAFDHYVNADSVRIYGTICFYVMEDGTIEVDNNVTE